MSFYKKALRVYVFEEISSGVDTPQYFIDFQ